MVKDMSAAQCEGISDLLEPFLDGELAESERESVARHVSDCAQCRQQLDQLRELHERLSALVPYKASADLADRVRDSLDQARLRRMGGSVWKRWHLPTVSHVAAALVGVVLGSWIVLSDAERTSLSNELVSAHVRSLMSGRPTDVASSDKHQVGPWFAGRVDFAPKVVDLTAQDFPLIGARVDYFQGSRAAVMVYRHRAHMIDVFVRPQSGVLRGTADWRRSGYNIVHWSDGEFEFWAISDLNAEELGEFAKLLRAS
jgi:anti-sigma factor RsiW